MIHVTEYEKKHSSQVQGGHVNLSRICTIQFQQAFKIITCYTV